MSLSLFFFSLFVSTSFARPDVGRNFARVDLLETSRAGPHPEGSENCPNGSGAFRDRKPLRNDRSVNKSSHRIGPAASQIIEFGLATPDPGEAKCCCGPHAVKISDEMWLWPNAVHVLLATEHDKIVGALDALNVLSALDALNVSWVVVA